MSSPPPTPSQAPSQIFAQLMATGAIDRFRKSLEKLINPLSQARHNSISSATESFLQRLPSVQHVISNPKQLLQLAKDATMTSVREDVINDVQQTAVSDAAVDLRKALRHAFDSIINPPAEQPKLAPQPIPPTPSKPSISQPQPTHNEPPAIAKAHEKEPSSPAAKHHKLELENKIPKQTPPVSSQTSRADNHSAQHSQPSQQQRVDIQIETPGPPTKQSPPPSNSETLRLETIPTDLFQTAHNILELKAKRKEVHASAAKDNSNSERTPLQSSSPSPSRSRDQTAQQPDRRTPNCSRDHNKQTARSVALRTSPRTSSEQREPKKHGARTMNEGNIEQSSSQAPEASEIEKGSASVSETVDPPRKKQGVSSELKAKSVAESKSTVKSKRAPRGENDKPGADAPSQMEHRKRRKSQKMLESDDVASHKRRRKSQLVHREACSEGEASRTDKRKRSGEETAPAPGKKPRKGRRQSDAVASKGSERLVENRYTRGRRKGSETVLDPEVAVLVDPRNPKRPRGYEVSEPSCVPEDYDLQARLLPILEIILEQDYSSPFAEPVDLGDEGQSSYLREIRNPMDLGTIVQRLKQGTRQIGFFNNVNEVLADIELVWWNCAEFNGAFDPVVEDMNRCKAELSEHIKSSALFSANASTQQMSSTTNRKDDEMQTEMCEEESERHSAVGSGKRKQQMDVSKTVPSDLNDGRLQGKSGVIFRYVEDNQGNKRKEWSSCRVVDYDASSRSYTLRWGDGTETTKATIGVNCMFNIHRFRTD
eukprot:TRINITY_DN2895_c0_g1_i1.p1 TRINITY_DN2895_c0_g1~~TRINITY_DN2895_c0_g1_i1.p1  ORF type:complete len:768 (-),score=128.19 TRINITY_DN2895_c0_g1_i1:2667-4970(-)